MVFILLKNAFNFNELAILKLRKQFFVTGFSYYEEPQNMTHMPREMIIRKHEAKRKLRRSRHMAENNIKICKI